MIYMQNQSNQELVQKLIQKNILKSQVVKQALLAIDRKFYTKYSPYEDSPQSIGYGATISAPHMHVYALEHLRQHLQKSKYVLDVGSGSGYLTAAMAKMVPSECKVFGIEHVPELVKLSIENISKDNPQLLKQKIQIEEGDGRKGWTMHQGVKFDAIHVGAAPEQIPNALLAQLAEGGRMVIPVGKQHAGQQFIAIDKQQGKTITTNLLGVRYVPLTDLKTQLLH